MKIIRAAACLFVAGFGVLTACDKNPIAEDRDTVFRLELNPKTLVVARAADKPVTGYAVNRYGEATFDAVTATPCNANIALRPDSTLLSIEPPTRVIARGVTAGTSCVVFTGGGFTDTVRVTVQ